MTRFLRKHLREARVFYDVGAATGRFSRLARRTMRDGTIVAFEPDVRAFSKLRRLSVAVEPVALGAIEGDGVLEIRPTGYSRMQDASARVVGRAEPARRVTVPVRTLDSYLDMFPPPDVVKIDVEGAEMDVLRGGRATVKAARAMVIECHSMPLLRDVLAFVLEGGFDRVAVTHGGDYIGPPAVLAAR